MSPLEEGRPVGSAYVETFGHLAVYRNGVPFLLQAGGVGPPQHRQMLGLLVSRLETPVPGDSLIEIARMTPRSRRRDPPDDPNYLLRALLLLLERTGMREALEQRGRTWILHRRPELWRTDGDDMLAWFVQARAAAGAGDSWYALGLLRKAEALYVGPYLPELETGGEPDLSIDAELRRWEDFQRTLRHSLARLCLTLPDYSLHLLALEAMQRCCAVTPDRESLLLAAEAAAHTENRLLAAYYRRQAEQADDPFELM